MIIFVDTDKIGSKIIRSFTRSKWSHVAIEHNGWVVHSTVGEGVHTTTLEHFNKNYDRYLSVKIPHTCSKKIFDIAYQELGKKYDWTAIFGIGLNRDWQEDDSWFCSELVANAIIRAGYPILNPECKLARVTPEDLFKVNLAYIIK